MSDKYTWPNDCVKTSSQIAESIQNKYCWMRVKLHLTWHVVNPFLLLILFDTLPLFRPRTPWLLQIPALSRGSPAAIPDLPQISAGPICFLYCVLRLLLYRVNLAGDNLVSLQTILFPGYGLFSTVLPMTLLRITSHSPLVHFVKWII